MPHNNKSDGNEYSLEEDFQMVGLVFSTQTGMPTNSHNQRERTIRKQPASNSRSFLGADGDYILRYLQTLVHSVFKQQKMAIKAAYLFMFNFIGWASLLLNGVLAMVGGIDEIKQWVLLVFSCLFAAIKIWQGYQTVQLKKEEARTKRIENDEREFKLKLAHEKHLKILRP